MGSNEIENLDAAKVHTISNSGPTSINFIFQWY